MMTNIDRDALFLLVEGLRERGVQYLRHGDLELVLTPEHPNPLRAYSGMDEEQDESEVDESLLFHSATT